MVSQAIEDLPEGVFIQTEAVDGNSQAPDQRGAVVAISGALSKAKYSSEARGGIAT
jgi:hypothetical protein